MTHRGEASRGARCVQPSNVVAVTQAIEKAVPGVVARENGHY